MCRLSAEKRQPGARLLLPPGNQSVVSGGAGEGDGVRHSFWLGPFHQGEFPDTQFTAMNSPDPSDSRATMYN